MSKKLRMVENSAYNDLSDSQKEWILPPHYHIVKYEFFTPNCRLIPPHKFEAWLDICKTLKDRYPHFEISQDNSNMGDSYTLMLKTIRDPEKIDILIKEKYGQYLGKTTIIL